jgi:hypothetical protein
MQCFYGVFKEVKHFGTVINIMFVAGTSLIVEMIIKGLITYLLAALVMKSFS